MTIDDTRMLDENLFTLFALQARRRPEATAVIDASGATSYSALEARARQIADALILWGLGAEQPVGVLMHRTSDLLATLLGILKAGGCYVPLDPDDPPERARRIITSAGCTLVLGHTSLLQKLQASIHITEDTPASPVFVEVERLRARSGESCPSQQLPQGGNRLAYILFTSGSTGMPKGVEVEHRNVVRLLITARDLLGVSESDRYLATSTVGFDSSVAEMYLPMITGGAVILYDRSLVLGPRRLANEIRKHEVSVLMTGPSVWSVALAAVPDFPRLRIAISHGEALPRDLALRLIDIGDTAWNLYGPTETTVWATGHQLGHDKTAHLAHSVSAPIGRPLAHVDVQVMDEQGVQVPTGVEGELWIGGPALARGYRGNEQLTRERFITIGANEQRFYRTGDVVVEDATGTLHYFGRNDDQIKVRGVRIEPMEVESALLSHPGVTQAAVTWFATTSGTRSIVAAVVMKPGCCVSAEDFHQYLSGILSATMVPSRFVFCEALPLLPSGKVDRNTIRVRAADIPVETTSTLNQDEGTDTERTLIRIWERTLGIHPVRRTDHFFTIGGDSLSGVTVMLEVEAAFKISLPFRALFEASTLDRFAERIERERSQPHKLDNPQFIFPLTQQGRGTPMFFSTGNLKLAQKGLWSVDCPLYAVSLWAQGSGFVKANSLEELARFHIDNIRTIQPHGPYRLAGYSFGGLVALEIAQQLRHAGERIELLFLLDPSEPFTSGNALNLQPSEPVVNGAYDALGPGIKAGRLMQSPRNLVPSMVRRVGGKVKRAVRVPYRRIRQPLLEWLSYHLVDLYGRNANPVSTRLLPKNRWPAFCYASKRLGKSYVPRPYEGDVLAVFVDRDDRYALWHALLGPTADIRVVESSHAELFSDPALPQWLEMLRIRLDGASEQRHE
ncbi:MAG: amino acid adenylation domain-containing protein [Deltaproteobacteria bacterium]|nr:amino acid adenylation domain-containing protein [Deltaproteobacteria bacterium]